MYLLGFPSEFQFLFPSKNLPEIFPVPLWFLEKVLEDREFRDVFQIFPERNSGMCPGNQKISGKHSGNWKISRIRSINRKNSLLHGSKLLTQKNNGSRFKLLYQIFIYLRFLFFKTWFNSAPLLFSLTHKIL